MKSQLNKVPFTKQLVGSVALIMLGFNYTKRYMTFPHHHKDESQPITLLNNELHPFERQPPVRYHSAKLCRVLLILISLTFCIRLDEENVTPQAFFSAELFNSMLILKLISLQMRNLHSIIVCSLFLITSHTQKQMNQFCQFDSDCSSSCCFQQKCQDLHTCSIMAQISKFEKKNYCKLDLDCDGGKTECCFEQKCVPSQTCVVEYYVPLIVGMIIALMLGFAATFFINYILKKQAEEIKQELRRKQVRKARKKKKEQQRLLHGDADQSEQEIIRPIPGTGGVEFINGQEPIANDPPVDIDLFLNGSKPQNPMMMVKNQQMTQQQLFFMQQMMIAQRMKMQQQQQNLQVPDNISRSMMSLPQTPPFNSSGRQQREEEKPDQMVSQSYNSNLQKKNEPMFYGKPNPYQNLIEAKNPLYAEYKPTVPNSGKIEQNLIQDAQVDADLNEKRSILKDVRGPLIQHIVNQYKGKEGPLPNDVRRN